ncbi:SH3 domain-containing protein [Algivirga pacifica]
MRILTFITLLYFTVLCSLNAQKLGYINDPDGYTNLRSEASAKAEVIGIIVRGQEFTYYPEHNSSWWKVDFKFRTGVVHKSRIE